MRRDDDIIDDIIIVRDSGGSDDRFDDPGSVAVILDADDAPDGRRLDGIAPRSMKPSKEKATKSSAGDSAGSAPHRAAYGAKHETEYGMEPGAEHKMEHMTEHGARSNDMRPDAEPSTPRARARSTSPGKRKPAKRMRAIFGGDKVLWVVLVVLLIFSMLLTFSATVYKPGGTPADKLFTQLVFIVFGIGSLLLVHFIRYQFYGRIANSVFVLGLVLTLLALFIGPEGAEARRDLDIPFTGVRFQPFEILKIGLVMLLARRLARRQKNMDNTPIMPSFNPSVWKEDPQEQMDIIRKQTIPLMLPIVLACIVTFLAVGNSTTLIIGATCLVMLYIGRIRMADLGKIAALAAIAAVIFFAAGLGRSSTGSSRMASFKPDMLEKHARVNSEGVEVYDYPATVAPDGGVSPAESEQSISAKMSIASGKIFGKGPGMSTHRSNLAEAERDFAYAFIIEEYGALGGLLILLLFLWLFFRAIEIFKKCGTAFPSLLVLGLGLMITMQAMIHMLVSVALFPVTGQQLPLISKGGSSLVFTLMALGMILGVSRQTDNKTLDAPKGESLFENKK